jgi:hypothetical protein
LTENPRFRWLVDRLYALGPRAVGELLAELAGEHLIRVPIERKLERYAAALDPAILRAIGGDRFPPPPIHLVGKDL